MNFWDSFAIWCPIVNELIIEAAKEMTLKSILDDEQKTELANLLQKFEFARKNSKLGCAISMKHKIDVSDVQPIRQ